MNDTNELSCLAEKLISKLTLTQLPNHTACKWAHKVHTVCTVEATQTGLGSDVFTLQRQWWIAKCLPYALYVYMYIYLAAGSWAKYCNQRVCMFVCLSVRSHISKTTCPNFTKFPQHVTCGCRSVIFWRQCNTFYTSGSVYDVMFEHNGANRPKSSTTLFCPLLQVAAPGRSLSSPTTYCLCSYSGKCSPCIV